MKECCRIIRNEFPNPNKYDSVKTEYSKYTILGDCRFLDSENRLKDGKLPDDYVCTRLILVADVLLTI